MSKEMVSPVLNLSYQVTHFFQMTFPQWMALLMEEEIEECEIDHVECLLGRRGQNVGLG